jgi:PKD repeat protein
LTREPEKDSLISIKEVTTMARTAAFWGGFLLLGSTALVQAQTVSTQRNPSYTFSTPGAHQVTLTTCNWAGCTTATKTVNVLNPLPSIVSAVVGVATAEVGQLISLSGSGKGKPPLVYTWRLLQGTTLVRQVSGALGWMDTEGLAPGVYAMVLRISNGSGQVDSLPSALVLLPPAATDFYTVTPCRFLDTRIGAPLLSGVTRVVSLDGACDIPANARALAVNITTIIGSGVGSVVLFPGNYPIPGTSTINFVTGGTRANNAIMPLSSDGTGKLAILATIQGSGVVHATIDVVGYFAP